MGAFLYIFTFEYIPSHLNKINGFVVRIYLGNTFILYYEQLSVHGYMIVVLCLDLISYLIIINNISKLTAQILVTSWVKVDCIFWITLGLLGYQNDGLSLMNGKQV